MPQQPEQPVSPAGRVFLIGAGPGHPGYITLRGAECLAASEFVLYDYLVNPAILRHACANAELICLGQHGRTRIWSQDEINTELVRLSRAGKTVARLKSGDATVFARAAEELDALTSAGIPFEIVPGVTAALGAGSCAGIPLTHRDFASAVALITGKEVLERDTTSLDFGALARFPGTLVFYMGVTTVHRWTAELISAGKPPDTPAAVIRRCSFPDQRTIVCRLDEVAERMTKPEAMRPPVVVVVGEVSRFSQQYSWFEKRPLFGRRILVTRPIEQAEDLARPLAELGADVLVQPAIRISPPKDWSPVDAALARLDQCDWVVFSSGNGVRGLLERLLETGHDLRALGSAKLAVIGPGTGDELAGYHLRADLMPGDEFRAESLADALVQRSRGARGGKRFLLVRASRGREVLAETLAAAGCQVEQVVVYQSEDITAADPTIVELLARGEIDWVTVTSSAIAQSLVRMFGNQLRSTKLVSISPITTATLRELGYDIAAEASRYTMDGVVQALLAAEKTGTSATSD